MLSSSIKQSITAVIVAFENTIYKQTGVLIDALADTEAKLRSRKDTKVFTHFHSNLEEFLDHAKTTLHDLFSNVFFSQFTVVEGRLVGSIYDHLEIVYLLQYVHAQIEDLLESSELSFEDKQLLLAEKKNLRIASLSDLSIDFIGLKQKFVSDSDEKLSAEFDDFPTEEPSAMKYAERHADISKRIDEIRSQYLKLILDEVIQTSAVDEIKKLQTERDEKLNELIAERNENLRLAQELIQQNMQIVEEIPNEEKDNISIPDLADRVVQSKNNLILKAQRRVAKIQPILDLVSYVQLAFATLDFVKANYQESMEKRFSDLWQKTSAETENVTMNSEPASISDNSTSSINSSLFSIHKRHKTRLAPVGIKKSQQKVIEYRAQWCLRHKTSSVGDPGIANSSCSDQLLSLPRHEINTFPCLRPTK